jgi:nicotinamide-nucleotide amidase
MLFILGAGSARLGLDAADTCTYAQSTSMSAAILSIGTELTRGELLNANACWLGARLTELGFDVVEHATIADDSAQIAATVVRFGRQVKVLVVTGGLGPTSDDMTAAAVAELLGVPVLPEPASLEALRARYRAQGRTATPMQERMAHLPQGARALPNPVGSAVGFALSVGEARVYFMPGVPGEMRAIFDQHIAAELAPLAPNDRHQEHLRCFGLTESQVASRLVDLEPGGRAHRPGVSIGYRAHFGDIEVKVLAQAADREVARALSVEVAAQARERLGAAVYGGRGDSYPAVLGARLRARGLTLAVAESCTGGLVGKLLTDVPGSSDYLLLDVISYANLAKQRVLGVEPALLERHGAVSAEVVAAMAEGVRRSVDAELAVAITGIAGPGGGSAEKPVGTVWFALARRGAATRTEVQRFMGDRERVRHLSADFALALVGQAIEGSA